MGGKLNRLKYYDYSSDGIYYVTINTLNRVEAFGEIVEGCDKVILSESGKILEEEWHKTAVIRKEVTLGEFTIMPDHFHGIIIIGEPNLPEYIPPESQHFNIPHTKNFENKFGPQYQTLGRIVGSIKAACTTRIHLQVDKNFDWQVSFYDEVIRDLTSKKTIEDYIRNNIYRWKKKP